MNIPQTVKVGGMTYTVHRVNHPLTVGEHECYGRIMYSQQSIEIRDVPFHSEQNMQRTFFHELIHAFTHERGIDWGEKDELYTEELAKALHAFCVDNDFGFHSSEVTSSGA